MGMKNNVGRIQIHGSGVGEISEADIERRAREIALADGRNRPGAQDLAAAREELTDPRTPPAPEADETVRPVELWSKAAASVGHRGVHTSLDDEQSGAEQLVNEGLEEADRDQRVSAGRHTEKE